MDSSQMIRLTLEYEDEFKEDLLPYILQLSDEQEIFENFSVGWAPPKRIKIEKAFPGDHNFPHEAIKIINKVLQVGALKHPPASWRKETPEHHISKAHNHLHDYLYGVETNEDSLAHAFTRLAMAVSLREER